MVDFILAYEANLRLGIFLGLTILFMSLEALFARKTRTMPRSERWITNLSMVIIDTIFIRLLFPIAAVGVAVIAAQKGWGIFNLTDWPFWLEIILAMIVLDMMIYWQHVAFHHIPFLWQFHKVHHVDRDIDVTTATRFHPIEIAISLIYKMAVVLCLGPSVIAVIAFEILLNGCALFNHANLRLPRTFDAALRYIIVTPDMHRVHHSVLHQETNSNYGFCLSLWDRLFKSYTHAPQTGHDAMTIGLAEHQTKQPNNLLWSLALPLKSLISLQK